MATTKGNDLAAFQQQFDKKSQARAKIKAILAALGDKWIYESELAKRTGVATQMISALREEFADRTLRVPSGNRNTRVVWAGTPKMADAMRAVLS